MNVAAEQLARRAVTADDLIKLGERVGRFVAKAKAGSHEEQSEPRRLSAREIAEAAGVSHSTVNRISDQLFGKAEGNVGRGGYRYDLNEAIAIRHHIGDVRRRDGQQCVVIGVVNFKGGVAKSTTTGHLGHAFALKGYRTLCIDSDPQATLSTLYGIHPDIELGDEHTLLPFYAGDEDGISYAIRPSKEMSTLHVIPANVGLAGAELELPRRQTEETAKGTNWKYMNSLRDAIRKVEDDYDIILIDCPPSMSFLTTTVIQACDSLLIPMRPSMPDFASSAQFIRMLAEYQSTVDELLDAPKAFDWVHVLLTMTDNNSASHVMEQAIRKAYGEMVLGEKFPYMAAVANAAKRMRTLYDVSRSDVEKRSLDRSMMSVDPLINAIEQRVLAMRETKQPAPTKRAKLAEVV